MNKLVMVVMSLVPGVALAQTPSAKAPTPPAKAPPAGGGAAAKAPVMAPPPAMPTAPPEVKATVDAFKGNWKFDSTLSGTGVPGMEKPMTMKMSFNCKEAAGKTAAECEAKAKTPMGPMEALFVIAYDPYSKAVHFVSFTNQNEVHDHVCKWSGYELNCTPLKGGMGPGGDEVTEDIKMTFEAAPTCKPKEGADPMVSCPPKSVSFTSVAKMTKGGGTVTFEGKGKR